MWSWSRRHFFINSNDDFNQIKNCPTVNGSIFINGDYNIQSLEPMNNINTIEGYLLYMIVIP